jgi:predicted GNAT family acetyltransferase
MSDQPAPAIAVSDAPERRRFEATVEGELAGFARYHRLADRVVFLHTEVDPSFEGRGVGSTLAKGALDAVRASGLRVEPRCPFFAAYIRRHAEYADLVAATGPAAP